MIRSFERKKYEKLLNAIWFTWFIHIAWNPVKRSLDILSKMSSKNMQPNQKWLYVRWLFDRIPFYKHIFITGVVCQCSMVWYVAWLFNREVRYINSVWQHWCLTFQNGELMPMGCHIPICEYFQLHLEEIVIIMINISLTYILLNEATSQQRCWCYMHVHIYDNACIFMRADRFENFFYEILMPHTCITSIE